MKSKKETIDLAIIDAMKKIHPKIKTYVEQLESENKRLREALEAINETPFWEQCQNIANKALKGAKDE